MKHLVELMAINEVDDLPTIYCDMDQVLCDFLKGADKAVGGSFVTMNSTERWKKLNQTKNFWANLDWMPGGKQLYRFISRYNPHILSAYAGKDKNSRVGKMKWLSKNTKVSRGNIHLVVRSDKKSFAKGNNLLIDDYEKNIKEWENAGGQAILHTNTNKTISELKKLGFK